jgi:gamma-glutamyl:cysteine ligase YbdK (ATP-grasp superfamily)
VLADPPNVDGSKSENRSLPEGLPIRRIGLEQEFFLVFRSGVLRDLADPFLRRCREAAHAAGLDSCCFKAECAKGLLEIATPPSNGVEELAKVYLNNLHLALGVASELGLALYPLGTYPLPIRPALRDDPSYAIKARTIGYERFLGAGRCAGTLLHLELPPGTVWPDVKAALDAPIAAQQELLVLYNLATALDPALVALTRACPFYEGRADGFAARTVHYRGILGFDGLYADLREVGDLSAYASRVEDLVDQQRARYRAWFAAMDLAGVERRLFAQAGGNLHRASWNPVRLSHHGTVEIRSIDANFPEMVLAACALIRGAADRVRRERLEVRPSRGVLTLEPNGDLLHVPIFSYLNGELLAAAVTRGVRDQRVEAYVNSVVRFATPYLESPELVEPLGFSGSYRTTECEILASFPDRGASLTRDQGLSLVRWACRRMSEQVYFLRRRYDETPSGDEHDPETARVIYIRDSPTVFAKVAQTASVDDAQTTSKAGEQRAYMKKEDLTGPL